VVQKFNHTQQQDAHVILTVRRNNLSPLALTGSFEAFFNVSVFQYFSIFLGLPQFVRQKNIFALPNKKAPVHNRCKFKKVAIYFIAYRSLLTNSNRNAPYLPGRFS
jgi:hypothetical protein